MFFSRIFKAALGLFRSSLQIRALVYVVALTGTALVVLGGALSITIGNGLFSTRTEHTILESARAKAVVQRIFQEYTGSSTWELNQGLAQVLPELEQKGVSQSRTVAFINTSKIKNAEELASPTSEGVQLNLITRDFRELVSNSNDIQNQTIQVRLQGETVPAVLTGEKITLPGGYDFQLYLVYDMKNEQETLWFVQWTLFFGGFFSLSLIGLFTYIVTNWLVKPVQSVAEASELLASGDLSRRLPVRGTDVVAVLATSFNHMAESLQEKINDLGHLSTIQQRFVSDVSHELRTPLTTMRLSADFLHSEKDRLPENSRRSVEILQGQVDRFDRLLTDLLEISRYDAANVVPEFETHDMNGIVGGALESIQQFADSKGVRLLAEVPSGEILCDVDARRIDRVLNNLLTNAIEHSEGKPVTIRVAHNEKAVAVSVTDQGVGMTELELMQVFNRFYRADPSRKRTTGGTGLGLAIAFEDAQAHQGMLEVIAEPQRGACFRLTVPKIQGFTNIVSPLPLAVEN
jgi:two-component system sensor histidine kinase MtrB